jgi:4'-phosphopantetheinyl transferase
MNEKQIIHWSPAPSNLRLQDGQIDLWSAWLVQPVTAIADLARVLSPDERDRCARFYFQADQRRYTVSRGALRRILGAYLDTDSHSLRLATTSYGKPYLEGEPAHFNVTHSHELALIAVAMQPVGVDVEYTLRRLNDRDDLAERFFARTEYQQLQSLPVWQRTAAFFNCWTRKEAYIKALGEGLSHPLDRFAVTLGPGEPARFLHINDDPAETAAWSLYAFTPAVDYVAALAAPGTGYRLRYFQFLG